MSDNIFQDIWDADQRGNGIPALRPHESKEPSRGYVVVDERATSVDSHHKVFQDVLIPDRKQETYRLCDRLFDNYALERSLREQVSAAETQEELDFINAILPTPPIDTARKFLESSLDLTITPEMLAAMIKETWFMMGQAGSQDDASGFEHVFVGEQSSKASDVGGYHFWYKYYLDDAGDRLSPTGMGRDRIDYIRTRYDKAQEPDKGILVPEIVTLELRWDAPGGDGGQGRTLKKSIGGFFVGCSPEGLIALGLVRCRTQSNKITRINGAEYQLDLHRLDGNPNAIRTFFPRFRKADVIQIIPQDPDIDDSDDTEIDIDREDLGAFQIVAAMVNPPNPEGGREFLQIINKANRVESLAEWQVIAPNGTAFELADILVEPGEVFKFIFPTHDGILRNKSGTIQLRSPSGTLVQKFDYTRQQSKQEGQPILFQ